MANKKSIVSKNKEISELKKELEILKDTSGKLTINNGPILNKQLLTILQRTPQEHIYERPAKGGGKWKFVTGVYVKKVLNYVFGWLWDFQIIDKGKEGNQVWVQGRLTIKDKDRNILIVKEQFGRADIKFKKNSKEMLDYGNDLKAASTDALKKCASEIGIASDIYGSNEFKDIKEAPKKVEEVLKKPVLDIIATIKKMKTAKELEAYKNTISNLVGYTDSQINVIYLSIKEQMKKCV